MSHRDSRRIECRALVASTGISRHHGALQNALATSMYLGKLGERFKEQGLNVEAAARLEGSNVLWDQDEMAASIRMLQDTVQEVDLSVQDIHVGKPELLAKLVRAKLSSVDISFTHLLKFRVTVYQKHVSKSPTRSSKTTSFQLSKSFPVSLRAKRLVKCSTSLLHFAISSCKIQKI
jgi:hypothetical protein